MADFGTRLKELRQENNLRQKDLAEYLQLAQTTIANYEQQSRFPDQTTLIKIADYFNVSLDYLVGRQEVKDKQPSQPNSNTPNILTTKPQLPPLANQYLTALLQGKEEQAINLIQDALQNGLQIEKIYLEVLTPVLKRLGSLWEAGNLNIAQEHYITAITESIINNL
ncbi:MAG: B12-binding domain-containing protein, partial [Bacillota bacterium]